MKTTFYSLFLFKNQFIKYHESGQRTKFRRELVLSILGLTDQNYLLRSNSNKRKSLLICCDLISAKVAREEDDMGKRVKKIKYYLKIVFQGYFEDRCVLNKEEFFEQMNYFIDDKLQLDGRSFSGLLKLFYIKSRFSSSMIRYTETIALLPSIS